MTFAARPVGLMSQFQAGICLETQMDGRFAARGASMSFLSGLWQFMLARKKIWLVPMVFMIVLFGALILLTQGHIIGPMIYNQ
jgi:hypothetical protein